MSIGRTLTLGGCEMCETVPSLGQERVGVCELLNSINKPVVRCKFVAPGSLLPCNREQSKFLCWPCHPCWHWALKSTSFWQANSQPSWEMCVPPRGAPGPRVHPPSTALSPNPRCSGRRRPSALCLLSGVPVCRCLNKQH